MFNKLRSGLARTHDQLTRRIDAALRGRTTVDDDVFEELEEALIGADLGVETAFELLDSLRQDAKGGVTDAVLLRQRLADEMAILLLDAPQPIADTSAASMTLVVGINGAGKTTSIAKLAWRSLQTGRSVLLAAGDTFRAAAADQLAVWGERLGVPVVRQPAGADAAAVVFDSLQAARARGIDDVIIDTAGRVHTKKHLMAELAKISRVAERESAERRRRTLLVLDATNGQNAVSQARDFSSAVPVDGVFLAKLDGTAKGGIALAVARELRLPVLYLGVGEQPEDIVDFDAREFVRTLLE